MGCAGSRAAQLGRPQSEARRRGGSRLSKLTRGESGRLGRIQPSEGGYTQDGEEFFLGEEF
ncbi:hypothetical protein E2562_027624 [Oryza meyeriana var. granulata]|uniref:Uncharacterized protein n=1 Tax=Oryza meyeriana var. granulata TaxID=110450 RepID=A0A6G1E2P8_9ORYZ|nr:hypothetical protein E2562_027624 [Oryza meyeriana var. granulata]